ncbi:MAG: ABC transporter permease [Desulfatitalea sp. BRH_c12]|nr:MAG: ABC transporter permease [Desulfatitalea sp. BRH_c12]
MTRDQVRGFWFLSPLFGFIGLFILIPVLGTIADSLFRDIVYLPVRFVFLENFRALWADPSFWSAVRFSALFVLVSVPLEVLLGLGIALVLNEPFALRGWVRACILIPWAIPAAVAGRIFQLVYNFSYGAANYLLDLLSISREPLNWLGSDLSAFIAVVVADAWQTTPFAAIILLAGLAAIPEDLYGQAKVDQAGMVARFRHITLPLLKPVLIVTLLFRTIQALRIFDIIFVLTGGGPGGATESLSMLAYRHFAAGDFGYGSAASVVLFLMAVVAAIAYVRVGRFQET